MHSADGIKITDGLEKHFPKLQQNQKQGLHRLGIHTIEDLVFHLPSRYGDVSQMKNISDCISGETAVIFGQISKLKTSKAFRTKITMAEARITDDSGSMKVVWFNQPYIAKMIPEDALVRVEGKISTRRSDSSLYMSNPKIEKVSTLPTAIGQSLFGPGNEEHHLYPVYPEARGISSNWIFFAIQKIFSNETFLNELIDPLPQELLEKYHLPGLKTALIWIHTPKKEDDALSARKRFAFEEVFFIQLEKQQARRACAKIPAFTINTDTSGIENFIGRFPFKPTLAQHNAINQILNDFKKGQAMSRLLEGDVGSGKTAVAAATVYAVTTTRPKGQDFGALQTAYMVPTEILAKQHFENFIRYFEHMHISVCLITGNKCRKFPSKVNPKGWTDISRAQLLKWVANGEIPIVIGTHALIQKTVRFKNLAYVIIDEQHRFGIAQRQKLVRKDTIMPHLLSMTATPIPRTLALTIHGDLDLTVLDQMPEGRKPIITEIVLPNGRDEMYQKVRHQLEAGRQAYVICPRINEPDPNKELSVQAKSVKEEAKRLKKSIFPEFKIGIVHSKMKPLEKEQVMNDFSSGTLDILVATSVVEVGVNVPNATVIIIEGAERYGLSQLHQLRGRVIRSNHQAYCFIYAESAGQKTVERLKALKTAKNGFELAEFDLQFRGAGELSGSRQWGISDIAMEALKNIKMVEAARSEASNILDQDETLVSWPNIQDHLAHRKTTSDIHFE